MCDSLVLHFIDATLTLCCCYAVALQHSMLWWNRNMFSFWCNSCNLLFDSKFGLDNHKHWWGCTKNGDANVCFAHSNTGIATDTNNATVSFVHNISNVNNDNRTAQKVEIMQNMIPGGSVMAHEIVHNKAFTMLYDAMMESYESTTVADRYNNVDDSDDEYEFVDGSDNEAMDNGNDVSMEEDDNNNTAEIAEDTF